MGPLCLLLLCLVLGRTRAPEIPLCGGALLASGPPMKRLFLVLRCLVLDAVGPRNSFCVNVGPGLEPLVASEHPFA